MNELIAFVMAGRIRQEILENLSEGSKTPLLLAKAMKTHKSTTSRALKALESQGLVKCLTPESKRPRLYGITEMGKKVIGEIKLILKTS